MRIGITLVFFGMVCGITTISAQINSQEELYDVLKKRDSLLFGETFNKCQLELLDDLLAEDLEFYHDKGGITEGKSTFIENFRNGICGNPNFKSRRELLPESLKVYPLYDQGKLYGAIQEGVHRFFESHNGAPEIPGSIAKFTHLWLKDADGEWKIKRVLSYDHQMK